MKLAKYGVGEWLGSGITFFLVIIMLIIVTNGPFINFGLLVSAFLILIWLGIAAFFRDPDREIPETPNVIVAPADGVIKDIETVNFPDDEATEQKKFKRIGIFLSVLDVHLNRAPCDLMVSKKTYKKGKFHDARDQRASRENESMTLAGTAEIEGNKFQVAVKQISGAIAQRIVCMANLNDRLVKGEKYGMIKFGSRTELYIPDLPEFELNIKIGDRVRAGSSILATLRGRKDEEKIS